MGDIGKFVDLALAQRGKPYVWGGEGPDSFDCSGLVMWCARQIGISVPHYSGAQYEHLRDLGLAITVEEATMTRGALLYRGKQAEEHVAISLGDGTTVEAMDRTLGIRKSTVRGRIWHLAARLPNAGSRKAAAAAVTPAKEEEPMLKDERVDRPEDGQAITAGQALRGAYLNGITALNAVLKLQVQVSELKVSLKNVTEEVENLRKVIASLEAGTK